MKKEFIQYQVKASFFVKHITNIWNRIFERFIHLMGKIYFRNVFSNFYGYVYLILTQHTFHMLYIFTFVGTYLFRIAIHTYT